MSARNSLRSFKTAPLSPLDTANETSRRPPKGTSKGLGYRSFHPVTSTLTILGFGLLGFFAFYNLARLLFTICTSFGL